MESNKVDRLLQYYNDNPSRRSKKSLTSDESKLWYLMNKQEILSDRALLSLYLTKKEILDKLLVEASSVRTNASKSREFGELESDTVGKQPFQQLDTDTVHTRDINDDKLTGSNVGILEFPWLTVLRYDLPDNPSGIINYIYIHPFNDMMHYLQVPEMLEKISNSGTVPSSTAGVVLNIPIKDIQNFELQTNQLDDYFACSTLFLVFCFGDEMLSFFRDPILSLVNGIELSIGNFDFSISNTTSSGKISWNKYDKFSSASSWRFTAARSLYRANVDTSHIQVIKNLLVNSTLLYSSVAKINEGFSGSSLYIVRCLTRGGLTNSLVIKILDLYDSDGNDYPSEKCDELLASFREELIAATKFYKNINPSFSHSSLPDDLIISPFNLSKHYAYAMPYLGSKDLVSGKDFVYSVLGSDVLDLFKLDNVVNSLFECRIYDKEIKIEHSISVDEIKKMYLWLQPLSKEIKNLLDSSSNYEIGKRLSELVGIYKIVESLSMPTLIGHSHGDFHEGNFFVDVGASLTYSIDFGKYRTYSHAPLDYVLLELRLLTVFLSWTFNEDLLSQLFEILFDAFDDVDIDIDFVSMNKNDRNLFSFIKLIRKVYKRNFSAFDSEIVKENYIRCVILLGFKWLKFSGLNRRILIHWMFLSYEYLNRGM